MIAAYIWMMNPPYMTLQKEKSQQEQSQSRTRCPATWKTVRGTSNQLAGWNDVISLSCLECCDPPDASPIQHTQSSKQIRMAHEWADKELMQVQQHARKLQQY